MNPTGLLRFVVVLSLAFLPRTAELGALQPSTVRELDEAKALYGDARFAECVTRLGAAIEKLRALPPSDRRRQDLIDAHLFLGLSKLALDQRDAAKAALVEIVRLDPERRLDPDVYAPKVMELFEEARREAGATTSGSGETSSTKTKKGSALPYILLGGAGAAAAGIAVARGGEQAVTPSPSPPPAACPSLPLPTWNAPVNTATVSGRTVILSCSVPADYPASCIASMFFRHGPPEVANQDMTGIGFSPNSASPYNIFWDSTTAPNGRRDLICVASAPGGAAGSGVARRISVVVDNR